jgi:hypothetical protein
LLKIREHFVPAVLPFPYRLDVQLFPQDVEQLVQSLFPRTTTGDDSKFRESLLSEFDRFSGADT